MTPKVYKAGNLRGEKITYRDGTGCCIWTPFKKKPEEITSDSPEDEEPGICFDVSAEDLYSLQELAHTLIEATPDIYEYDEVLEAKEAADKEKEKTLWYKVKNTLEDISISISPFDWRCTTLWIIVTRTVPHNGMLTKKCCRGFVFGPLTITW